MFRVASIPNSKTITYTGTASGVSTGGFFYHVGIATNVVNITHDALSGIATVLLTSDIGLRSGDQIVIAGCTGFSTVYNGTHFVSERVGYGSSLRVNIGVTSNAPAYAGVATAHGTGISIRGRGRGIPIYDGVTTRLTSGITTTTTSITLANTSMLKRGDYLLIEDEIVRISNTGATSIIRGVLGSNAVPHDTNVAVRRINVLPVENRRYSILRASGHTFEYLGYGPGNYSTAMPQAQDRVLDDNAVLLAQSVQTRGGLVVYTGMNDTGDFYIGKSKINAVTGLSGATGGISDAASSEKSTFATLTVDDLTVNNNFYSKGNTEVVDLALKGNRAGDIAQTVYVGIQAGDTCPSSATDNILLRTTFTRGGYIGWVRTNEANAGVRWKRWGKISHECTSDHYVFDKIGIGITYCADQYQFQTVGISTFNGNIFITGITTHVGNVQVAAGSSFIGAGTIPVGGIIMWSGSIASIPTGWALCNGSSGTPDLRDRFIVGAGNNYSVAGVGGTTDSQLPAHTHNVTNGSANSFTAVTSVSDEPVNQGGGGSVNVADQESSTTFTIESAGISSTNQNLPPYYALAFIMRTV